MKTKAICLTTAILLAPIPLVLGDSAAEELELRHANPIGKTKLSVSHDIRAERTFLLDLEFSAAPGALVVNINKARASYTAHGMTQRLPVSKLIGQSITLSKVDNGQSLQREDPDQDLEIPVGQIIGADYPIGLALVDLIPILPQGPVSVGSTWSTTQTIRSLEGWAWATGVLNSEHLVTEVEEHDGHTIVSVTSTSKAQLGRVENSLQYSGDGELSRTSNWRFDASEGRLLSISMSQKTSGINTLPQGEVEVRQFTKVEFTTQK
jgi:hypothetical protein